ncbi:MAG: hypothetical protein AAGG48_14975 [Planctomycetota bacterium]
MIRFRCPNCSRILTAKHSMADQKLTCPCGQDLRVPKPQAATSRKVVSDSRDEGVTHALCSACNRTLKVAKKNRGKLLKCPCGAKIRVDEEQQESPKRSQSSVVDSVRSAGADHLQTTGADTLAPEGFEGLSQTGFDDLPTNGLDDLTSNGAGEAAADTLDWSAAEIGFPDVDLPQPVNPAYLQSVPQPMSAPKTGLSPSPNPLLKKAMEEESADEEEEEEDSWYVQIGSGLFCIVCSIGLFMLLNNMEQSGGRMRVPWYVAVTYYIGGKWVVSGVLFGIGVLAAGLGIAAAFRTRNELNDDSV